MNSTEQRLRRQRQQLKELREKITAVRRTSGAEWAADLSYTLRRIEQLEYSLKKTGDALEQFRERVEVLNRQTIAEYSDALVRAQRVFS